MGLDMYLNRKTYVQNWDHMTADERHSIVVKRGGKDRKDIKPERISYITEHVAYWRKANQIHKWFVDNCSDGVDTNGSAYVSREQLQKLLDLCKQVVNSIETVPGDINTGTSFHQDGTIEHHTAPGDVIAQQGIAAKLLPTQSGFFFGSTNYDEGYIDDLKLTVEQLEPLLAIPEDEDNAEYEYVASW